MPDAISNIPGRQEIVDIYARALSRLKDIVAGEDYTLASKRYAARQIIEIQDHIKDLKKAQVKWADKYIPEAYKIGAMQDEDVLRRLLGDDYEGAMTALHREAGQVAAIGAAQDFDTVANALEQTFVGYVRQAQITGARRAVAQEIAGGIVEGATRKTVSNRLVDALKQKTIAGEITVGKVTMNVNAYADLLARTVSRAARTEGTINRLIENEQDLVIFNNTGAVDFCTQYEDQIFSISGQSKRFPKLVARPPLHPNCYSGDTEVYTENGWEKIGDVKVDEKCLSLNPETKGIEYIPVIARAITVPQYKMIHFESEMVDLLVTPDHQMFYMTDWEYRNWDGGLKFKEAKEFLKIPSGAFLLNDKMEYYPVWKIKIKVIDYNDLTYCVELEKYHTLWVRRNGKTCWSGNCTHSVSGWVEEFADEGVAERGSQFDPADLNKTAAEMNKKYPVEKDDTRVRTKKTQKAA